MSKNIWEINEKYFCPIAGFCLSTEEQNLILSKYVRKGRQKAVARVMHDFIIAGISKESVIAKYTQKILNKKYSEEITQLNNIEANEWIEKEDTFLNWKDFGAFIWVSASHKKLSEKDDDRIMHKIHMYSHEMYFEFQNVQKNLIRLENKYETTFEKYLNIRKKYKELNKEVKILKTLNNQFLSKNIQLEGLIENAKTDIIEKDGLTTQLRLLKQQLDIKEKEIKELKADNKQLYKKSGSQETLLSEIKHDFNEVISNFKLQQTNCNTCDRVDLCKKKVLIVGGLTKMESFYRKIVNEMGGQFNYHDGYCHQNESTLSNLIKKSDLVLCPVDVNSHAACLQVKKACKKTGTNFYMLRKSSISSVYNTLRVAASA
jgi:hypothetical protein